MVVGQFSHLDGWDIKAALAAEFRVAQSTFLPFGTFVEECADIVNPAAEPDHEWPVYGVNNREGVFLSHRQKGSDFNAAYKRIKPDWFFHNPTRANVGSIGRVPETEANALTSPEYQVWRIKDGSLLPAYVEILVKTAFFNSMVQVHRVGAVKQRLFVRNLMAIPIPVVTLESQAAIVARWRELQDRAAEQDRRAQALEAEAQTDFLAGLGLTASTAAKRRKAFASGWAEMERWSADANRSKHILDTATPLYPWTTVGNVARQVQYGTSQKANVEGLGVTVIRMNNIVDGRLVLNDLKHVVLKQGELDSLRLDNGDILFNRTNSKDLVGKCAVYEGGGEAVFASYLIRIKLDETKAIPAFVSFLVNGPMGREQIARASRQIIGQANINSVELRALQLPLPPLRIQSLLVSTVATARHQADAARGEAARLRALATVEAESAILGRLDSIAPAP